MEIVMEHATKYIRKAAVLTDILSRKCSCSGCTEIKTSTTVLAILVVLICVPSRVFGVHII